MPGKLFQLLEVRLRSFKNREAAHILAAFLARMNSGPSRYKYPFPVDRRALVGHPDLPLSEDRIRGALKSLEAVGYLDRIPDPRGEYERIKPTPSMPHKVKRRPIRFTFGADFLATFVWIAQKCIARLRSPKGTVGKINYPVNAEFYSEKKEIKPTVPLGEHPDESASLFARMAELMRSRRKESR
ncbi:MAG: hypothetical protein EOP84_24760 [Verrucomicrobiaceae bacterium]|nr:MAG: hypothetical protein EOP84_24760 [Verrucomicrobiaceae bacterium]